MRILSCFPLLSFTAVRTCKHCLLTSAQACACSYEKTHSSCIQITCHIKVHVFLKARVGCPNICSASHLQKEVVGCGCREPLQITYLYRTWQTTT